MNAISPHGLYLPRTHGAPCPRLLCRAAAFRDEAAEKAWELSQLPNWAPPAVKDRMLREHEALTLRAQAAHHMAYGHGVLGKHYVASARRVEGGA